MIESEQLIQTDTGFDFTQWTNRGKMLRGSVLVPSAQPSPWVIFSHGFTQHRIGPGFLYVKLARYLASQGIASLRFDFSGAGESDGNFSDMTFTTMHSDLVSAVGHVRAAYSPTACLLLGHSLGACVAAQSAALVDASGLILLAPVAFPMEHVGNFAHVIAGGPNKNGFFELGPHEMSNAFLDDLKSANPLRALAGSFHGAMLIFHGKADQRVRPLESEAFVRCAHDNAIAVEHHLLHEADHRFSTVSARAEICATMATWIKERFL
jgi:alpha-beta hydrolase superfamily lysophospholipase